MKDLQKRINDISTGNCSPSNLNYDYKKTLLQFLNVLNPKGVSIYQDDIDIFLKTVSLMLTTKIVTKEKYWVSELWDDQDDDEDDDGGYYIQCNPSLIDAIENAIRNELEFYINKLKSYSKVYKFQVANDIIELPLSFNFISKFRDNIHFLQAIADFSYSTNKRDKVNLFSQDLTAQELFVQTETLIAILKSKDIKAIQNLNKVRLGVNINEMAYFFYLLEEKRFISGWRIAVEASKSFICKRKNTKTFISTNSIDKELSDLFKMMNPKEKKYNADETLYTFNSIKSSLEELLLMFKR